MVIETIDDRRAVAMARAEWNVALGSVGLAPEMVAVDCEILRDARCQLRVAREMPFSSVKHPGCQRLLSRATERARRVRVRAELARQDMEVVDEEKTPSPRMLREDARCRRREVETYSIEQDVGNAERKDLATKKWADENQKR